MSGAGCSRVTHPFAARVPRKAFPLDLHVLSTPPAFVLSQDQTLQQKPCQRHPSNKQHCQKKQTWHWLIKHPVEFSKNNHTPFKDRSRGARPGHFIKLTRRLPHRQIEVSDLSMRSSEQLTTMDAEMIRDQSRG